MSLLFGKKSVGYNFNSYLSRRPYTRRKRILKKPDPGLKFGSLQAMCLAFLYQICVRVQFFPGWRSKRIQKPKICLSWQTILKVFFLHPLNVFVSPQLYQFSKVLLQDVQAELCLARAPEDSHQNEAQGRVDG